MYRVKTRVIPRDRAHRTRRAISNLIVEAQDWRSRGHRRRLDMK
jgi:hypothetical protein